MELPVSSASNANGFDFLQVAVRKAAPIPPMPKGNQEKAFGTSSAKQMTTICPTKGFDILSRRNMQHSIYHRAAYGDEGGTLFYKIATVDHERNVVLIHSGRFTEPTLSKTQNNNETPVTRSHFDAFDTEDWTGQQSSRSAPRPATSRVLTDEGKRSQYFWDPELYLLSDHERQYTIEQRARSQKQQAGTKLDSNQNATRREPWVGVIPVYAQDEGFITAVEFVTVPGFRSSATQTSSKATTSSSSAPQYTSEENPSLEHCERLLLIGTSTGCVIIATLSTGTNHNLPTPQQQAASFQSTHHFLSTFPISLHKNEKVMQHAVLSVLKMNDEFFRNGKMPMDDKSFLMNDKFKADYSAGAEVGKNGLNEVLREAISTPTMSGPEKESRSFVRKFAVTAFTSAVRNNPGAYKSSNSSSNATVESIWIIHSDGFTVCLTKETLKLLCRGIADVKVWMTQRRPRLITHWNPATTNTPFAFCGIETLDHYQQGGVTKVSAFAKSIKVSYTLQSGQQSTFKSSNSKASLFDGSACVRVSDDPFQVLDGKSADELCLVVVGSEPCIATYAIQSESLVEVSTAQIVSEVATKIASSAVGFLKHSLWKSSSSASTNPDTQKKKSTIPQLKVQGVHPHVSVAVGAPPEETVTFTTIDVDPTNRFAACYSPLGRIYIFDLLSGILWRVIKNCRAAECSWVYPLINGRRMLLLAVHLNLRGVIEFHSMRRKRRAGAIRVGPNCTLFRSDSLSLYESGSVLILRNREEEVKDTDSEQSFSDEENDTAEQPKKTTVIVPEIVALEFTLKKEKGLGGIQQHRLGEAAKTNSHPEMTMMEKYHYFVEEFDKHLLTEDGGLASSFDTLDDKSLITVLEQCLSVAEHPIDYLILSLALPVSTTSCQEESKYSSSNWPVGRYYVGCRLIRDAVRSAFNPAPNDDVLMNEPPNVSLIDLMGLRRSEVCQHYVQSLVEQNTHVTASQVFNFLDLRLLLVKVYTEAAARTNDTIAESLIAVVGDPSFANRSKIATRIMLSDEQDPLLNKHNPKTTSLMSLEQNSAPTSSAALVPSPGGFSSYFSFSRMSSPQVSNSFFSGDPSSNETVADSVSKIAAKMNFIWSGAGNASGALVPFNNTTPQLGSPKSISSLDVNVDFKMRPELLSLCTKLVATSSTPIASPVRDRATSDVELKSGADEKEFGGPAVSLFDFLLCFWCGSFKIKFILKLDSQGPGDESLHYYRRKKIELASLFFSRISYAGSLVALSNLGISAASAAELFCWWFIHDDTSQSATSFRTLASIVRTMSVRQVEESIQSLPLFWTSNFGPIDASNSSDSERVDVSFASCKKALQKFQTSLSAALTVLVIKSDQFVAQVSSSAADPSVSAQSSISYLASKLAILYGLSTNEETRIEEMMNTVGFNDGDKVTFLNQLRSPNKLFPLIGNETIEVPLLYHYFISKYRVEVERNAKPSFCNSEVIATLLRTSLATIEMGSPEKQTTNGVLQQMTHTGEPVLSQEADGISRLSVQASALQTVNSSASNSLDGCPEPVLPLEDLCLLVAEVPPTETVLNQFKQQVYPIASPLTTAPYTSQAQLDTWLLCQILLESVGEAVKLRPVEKSPTTLGKSVSSQEFNPTFSVNTDLFQMVSNALRLLAHAHTKAFWSYANYPRKDSASQSSTSLTVHSGSPSMGEERRNKATHGFDCLLILSCVLQSASIFLGPLRKALETASGPAHAVTFETLQLLMGVYSKNATTHNNPKSPTENVARKATTRDIRLYLAECRNLCEFIGFSFAKDMFIQRIPEVMQLDWAAATVDTIGLLEKFTRWMLGQPRAFGFYTDDHRTALRNLINFCNNATESSMSDYSGIINSLMAEITDISGIVEFTDSILGSCGGDGLASHLLNGIVEWDAIFKPHALLLAESDGHTFSHSSSHVPSESVYHRNRIDLLKVITEVISVANTINTVTEHSREAALAHITPEAAATFNRLTEEQLSPLLNAISIPLRGGKELFVFVALAKRGLLPEASSYYSMCASVSKAEVAMCSMDVLGLWIYNILQFLREQIQKAGDKHINRRSKYANLLAGIEARISNNTEEWLRRGKQITSPDNDFAVLILRKKQIHSSKAHNVCPRCGRHLVNELESEPSGIRSHIRSCNARSLNGFSLLWLKLILEQTASDPAHTRVASPLSSPSEGPSTVTSPTSSDPADPLWAEVLMFGKVLAHSVSEASSMLPTTMTIRNYQLDSSDNGGGMLEYEFSAREIARSMLPIWSEIQLMKL